MLRRLTQPLLRTFVTPRLGPNFMPPSSSLSTPLNQSLYQTPVPSYEKLLAGLYTPVVGQQAQSEQVVLECMQRTRRVAKLKRAKRKYGKRTVIKNE